MKILEYYKIDEIKEILRVSSSFKEFLTKIGHSHNGTSAYNSIKKQLVELGLEIPKYDYSHLKVVKNKIDNCSMFIENSTSSRASVKNRIIKEKLIEYKCKDCNNNGEWNGKKLVLQLEHINGINNDNRLSNLCFLCPNCHTQTTTYSGKKLKKNYICECGDKMHKDSKYCSKCNYIKLRKIERPNLENLKKEIDELGYTGTGRKYNVSDNAIRKWLKNMTS
jgi:hypothetical protein